MNRRCSRRSRSRPGSRLALAAFACWLVGAPGTSGATTVALDVLEAYVPEQEAAYWVVTGTTVDVPVVLDQAAPGGGANIPYVANGNSSAVFFSAGTSERTVTIGFFSGSQTFYPGWAMELGYFSLLAKQPTGFERGVPHTLYPRRVYPLATRSTGQECVVDWVCALLASWGLVSPESCGGFVAETNPSRTAEARRPTVAFAPVLQRYRDEVLASTQSGQYYIQVYNTHSSNMIHAIASDPALAARLFLGSEPWLAGLQALVDGQGDQFMVTQEMQDGLLSLLQRFENSGNSDLANMISFERGRLGLDSIAGMPMTQYQTQVETLGGPTAVFDRSWGEVKHLYRGSPE